MTQYKCDNIHKIDKNTVMTAFKDILKMLKIFKI